MRTKALVLAAVASFLASACAIGAAEDAPVDQGTATDQGAAGDQTPTVAAAMPALGEVELLPAPWPTTPGVHDLTVEVIDDTGRPEARSLRVHLPEGDGPFPLVIGLHPFGSSGAAFDDQTGLGNEGAARGAVVLLPDGIDGAWNASLTCCQPAVNAKRQDAEFVVALIDAARADLPIGPERAAVTGFSNGGYLSYRLACRAADRIGAVAVVAGTMDEPCAPSQPVSVLHLHGQDDLVVPFTDGRSPHSPQAASRGAADVVAAWARLNGCTQPEAVEGRTSWPDCADGTRVEFMPVAGLAHSWPKEDPMATEVVLDFLLQPRA